MKTLARTAFAAAAVAAVWASPAVAQDRAPQQASQLSQQELNDQGCALMAVFRGATGTGQSKQQCLESGVEFDSEAISRLRQKLNEFGAVIDRTPRRDGPMS